MLTTVAGFLIHYSFFEILALVFGLFAIGACMNTGDGSWREDVNPNIWEQSNHINVVTDYPIDWQELHWA